MGAFVVDPFQSVAPGSGYPPGWNPPAFGSGVVEPFSAGGPVPPHNWFGTTAGIASPVSMVSPWVAANITVNYFSQVSGGSAQGILFTANGPDAVTIGDQRPIAILYQERDGTISVYVAASPNVLCCNTGSYPLAIGMPGAYPGDWVYYQINLQVSTNVLTGTIELYAEIGVNGTFICSGTATSNFESPGDYTTVGFDQVVWSSGFGTGQNIAEPFILPYSAIPTYPDGIWTVDVTNGGSGYSPATTVSFVGGGGTGASGTPVISGGEITGVLFFPGSGFTSAPGVTFTDSGGGSGATATTTLEPLPFARIAQTPLEIAIEPSTAHVRIAQAPIELSLLPSTAHVRIAQMVIELMWPYVKGGGFFPEYVKRRTWAGNS